MTITLTHSEAVKINQELTEALNDKNLDAIQIVFSQTDINVVRLGREPISDPFTVSDHQNNI